MQISHAFVKWCFVGFGLTGSGQFDSIDPHASPFELIDTESCTIRIVGCRGCALR
jgi:hypothetical protein